MERYLKVKAAVITPIEKHYGGTLNEEQIEAFVEDLGGYGEDVLNAAWKEVRRTCRTRPTLAHVLDAVRANLAPASSAVPRTRKEGDFHCHGNAALADRVMRSPVGQLALREGVGYGLWMLAWRDGREDLSENDVWHQKRAWREACDRLAAFSDQASGQYKRLVGLHDAMQRREADLRKRFFGGVAA